MASNREGGVRKSALILAGAAGKGPYAAGALTVVAADPRFDVRCVVGASSGALNAAVFAAGLRAGRDAAGEAADRLCELWRTSGAWYRILTHEARVALVEDVLEDFRDRERRRDVKLTVVVASLPGALDERYGHLRFERTYTFDSAAFEDPEQLRLIAEVCLASSAIPLVFQPRVVDGEGPFWDGGVVNNTPIGHALKGDPEIDHLLVVTPDADRPQPGRYGRWALPRLLEMLIEERLARDLCEAKSFNEELEQMRLRGIDLDTLFDDRRWRLLQFVEIRPERDLPGNFASGFWLQKTRELYLDAGKRTAERALDSWAERSFAAPPSGARGYGAAGRGASAS